jgi:transmembrane sensor
MGDERTAGATLSDEAIAWLVALDGGTADEAAFETWRNADPRHAAAFAQVAATWRRTADPRLAGLIDHSAEALPQAEGPAPKMVSRRTVTRGTLAALVGLGSAGAFLAWPGRTYAATAVGERRTIRLPDGSHAILNTDTRLAWRFDKQRDVWVERGEAALLVRHGAQPLRLHSNPISAGLSDGKFSFRLGAESAQLLVLAGRATADRGIVVAGSVLTIVADKARIAALSPQAITAATAWQDGRIVFNGMTLNSAIAEYNRYLPEKIVLGEVDLGATQLGGAFQIDDPDPFLIGLQESFGIQYRRQGGQIVLFRAQKAGGSAA